MTGLFLGFLVIGVAFWLVVGSYRKKHQAPLSAAIPMRRAWYCVDCESIVESRGVTCDRCGSKAICSVSRAFGPQKEETFSWAVGRTS